MKIIEKVKITNQSDLIYVRHLISALNMEDRAFYLLAASELGTNILKYTGSGWIYIVQKEDAYILVAFDNGCGIENLHWAMQKGTTTSTNSLGLGLFQLSQNEKFTFEIFSLTQKDMHGTVAAIYPKNFDQSVLFLSEPYLNEKNNGDFFAKKGKFLIFGDASGHSTKSHATSLMVQEAFYKTMLSCIIIEEFFKQIHTTIKERGMRSCVCCVLEVLRQNVQICGVGNINIWEIFHDNVKYHTLKDGIVGEKISSLSKLRFSLKDKILLSTDGIEKRKANRLLKKLSSLSALMYIFVIFHFCKIEMDDTSLLIISKEKR